MIGSGPFSRFVLERLSVRQDFVAVAWCCTSDYANWSIQGRDCVIHTSVQDVIDDPRSDLIYFDGEVSFELIARAIQCRKHVILPPISRLSSQELRQLAQMAADQGIIVVVDEPCRWDDDFTCAKSVFDGGQLGRPERIRLSIHEQSLPGEAFSQGILRELGCHWLDQLLTFVPDKTFRAHLRTFRRSSQAVDDGFLATVEFGDGTSAVIELQIRSVLSLRTGWLLEGSLGAYRAGRLYTRTADGEIIDEPVSRPITGNDPFFDGLSAEIQGATSTVSSLPDLTHVARVMELIEELEESNE